MTRVAPPFKIKEVVGGYIRQHTNINMRTHIGHIQQCILLHLNGIEGVAYHQLQTDSTLCNADEIAPKSETECQAMATLAVDSVVAVHFFITNNPNKRVFCNEMKNEYHTKLGAIVKIYKHLDANRKYPEGIQIRCEVDAQIQSGNDCTLKNILFVDGRNDNQENDKCVSMDINNKIWKRNMFNLHWFRLQSIFVAVDRYRYYYRFQILLTCTYWKELKSFQMDPRSIIAVICNKYDRKLQEICSKNAGYMHQYAMDINGKQAIIFDIFYPKY